jgi:hypothetical protein
MPSMRQVERLSRHSLAVRERMYLLTVFGVPLCGNAALLLSDPVTAAQVRVADLC